MGEAAEILEQDERPSGVVAVSRAVYRQGNWKREKWVATEYEIRLAIDALLAREKVVVSGGVLALPERGDVKMRLALASVPRLTAEERWAREDDELRRYCQEIACAQTPSRVEPEADDIVSSSTSSGTAFSSIRGDPRKGIGKYVLREIRLGASTDVSFDIRRHGPATDTNVIRAIEEQGGLEWVLEDAREKGKGKKRR